MVRYTYNLRTATALGTSYMADQYCSVEDFLEGGTIGTPLPEMCSCIWFVSILLRIFNMFIREIGL